jgi:hypothetical protein
VTHHDATDLSPVLAAIASVAGVNVALEIARLHGGTRVIVPTKPGDNWLTDIAGLESAAAIIEAVGPARRLDVPLGPQGNYTQSRRWVNRRFAELEAAGATESQMARALGVAGRTVRRRRAKLRRLVDDTQGDLFGE